MKFATWLLALCFSLPVFAGEATPMADDPVVEQRLIAIADEVRCLVCQNESLAGSRAELAEDLRREIRTLIRAGKTDREIHEFLTSRYGDFVLYRPPFKPLTWLLWLGPVLLLGAGAWVVARRVRAGRAVEAAPAALDEAQRREALALLRNTEGESRP
ncbi:MAG: cytochrome c-type biogenesis protein CcmH [Burkholderiales bacterium]|nr:cytochrome c-type biogenesis protein CcmH [Burkholderiales bacterium]